MCGVCPLSDLSVCLVVFVASSTSFSDSICGSLPLVDTLKKAGFDIQLIGFGLSSVYHADNEYCQLSDMKDATKVLCNLISALNKA